ncbi:MAG: heme-binding protein, partial [Syntrophobacteraceae bacterium]|nr:heme-binding protein [Syntrophobacteraceae bacterium]
MVLRCQEDRGGDPLRGSFRRSSGSNHTVRISYPVARILCSVAEAEASRIGVPMAMAVTDENGCLLFFGRMDGALP